MTPIKMPVSARREFMLTLLLRITLVLTLVVAAILGHLTKMLLGFQAGFLVFVIVIVGLQIAIPLGAQALGAPGFMNIATSERRFMATVRELYAFWRTYVVLMPFPTFWMGEDKSLPSAPGAVPVVLVPGYCCNSAMWFDLARDLKEAGRTVATVDLDWPFADIDRLADNLDEHIMRVKALTGASKVLLVGHSMGGLVARARLARRGGDDVVGLITLNTPHHGSELARFAPGPSGRQMRPDSEWLAALNAKESPVPVHVFWSGRDEFVSPPESARIDGAVEICAPLCGHVSVLSEPEVLQRVLTASETKMRLSPAEARAAIAAPAPVEAPEDSAEPSVAPVEAAEAEAPAPVAPAPVEEPTVVAPEPFVGRVQVINPTPVSMSEPAAASDPENEKPLAGA
jgi:triacylglycerol lipase